MRRIRRRNTQEERKNEQDWTMELKVLAYVSNGREDEKMVCTIDLKGFSDGESVVVTPCEHFFHPSCMFQWLHAEHMEKKCPNCNKDLTGYGIAANPTTS
jgi:hypothetical protein